MNLIWLFAIAGGAVLLGAAIMFGIFKQDPARARSSLAGLAIVAIGAVGLAFVVSNGTETAPSTPADRAGSENDRPARASDQNALPGLQQPNR